MEDVAWLSQKETEMKNKGIVLSLVAALCLPLYGIASDLLPERQNGIQFLSGGIGVEERNAMQAESKVYNLKLSFSLKDGAYIADVKVAIDSGKKPLVRTNSDGPLFYAKLPPGKSVSPCLIRGKPRPGRWMLGKARPTCSFIGPIDGLNPRCESCGTAEGNFCQHPKDIR